MISVMKGKRIHMQNRFLAVLVPVAAVFFGFLAPPPAAGQSGGADKPLRTLDGKPDVSGVWTSPGFRHFEGTPFPDVPLIGMTRFNRTDYPFRPGGQELWNRKLNGNLRNDDPTATCLPWGFPHQTLLSNVQHFFQPPGYLIIVYEDMHFTRIIPMDGREHPKGLPRTYYGNSVGKYEGNVAVIDTVGLIPWGLDDSGSVPNGNHMFTDAAHFIERYQRLGPTTMSYELTIDVLIILVTVIIFYPPFTTLATHL